MRLNNLKKIIPAVMLAALCLSLLPVGIRIAQADPVTPNDTTDTRNAIVTNPSVTSSYGNYVGGSQDNGALTNTSGSAGTAAGGSPPSSTPGGNDIGCLVGAGGVGNTLAVCMSNIVYYIMVGVFSSIAYICAFFFDLAIQLSLNSTTYALSFLTTSWTIVRDLSNMAFIFILIYVAINVMLSAETAGTIKTLAIVIVVALLVNFSFFFTRVAIDAGNLLALQFYNAIQAPNISAASNSSLSSALTGGATNAQGVTSAIPSNLYSLASAGNTKDLTASIMEGIKVQNIISSESFKYYTQNNQGFASGMYILIALSTIYISVGIAFGILAGAFLYAGAKFMLRIVGLWFVIILSPLALVAAAVPQSKKLFNFWLEQLVNFSFYPAVFLFMFFVLTRFMKDLNANGNFLNGVFSQSLTASNDISLAFLNILSAIANVGVRLGFVVAMMYLALSAADMLAKVRKDITTGTARSWAGWMGGLVGGGAVGMLGRATFGTIGRVSGDASMANRTYDPRNIPLFGRALTGFKPITDKPHTNYGALPIDYGTGRVDKAREKAKSREDRRKDREEDQRDRARVQDEIEAERRARQGGQPPATPQQNQPPQPTPPAGGGGGGRRAATPAANPAANDNQPPAAQQRGATNQASATVQASNIQKILQGFNTENLKNIQGAIDTSSAKNLAGLKNTIDTSTAKNLGGLGSTKTIALDKTTLEKMTRMMGKVIRRQNEGLVQPPVSSRPPEMPKAPAGAAQRPTPPKADNDNFPDISKAA